MTVKPLYAVDPVNLVYRWHSDSEECLALLERYQEVHAFDGDFVSLPDELPAAGHYRTCNRLGLVQLGASPVGQLHVQVSRSTAHVPHSLVTAMAELQRELSALRAEIARNRAAA